MSDLASWQNFYVILGSSGSALIGLQFVVVSLVSGMRGGRIDALAGEAFATPAVLHFGSVLCVAATFCAPWDRIGPPAVIAGAVGLGGILYTLLVLRRMRTQSAYRPEFEDWLSHFVLPFVAYSVMATGAIAVYSYTGPALVAVGGSALLLLFVGIHNAWGAVTFHAYGNADKSSGPADHNARNQE
jgi:hypothetical protein